MAKRRKSERSTRRKLSSPERPPVWQRENIPPAEAEEAFYANLNTLDMVA